MAVISNNILAGASGQAGGAAAYEIERSLRFNGSDDSSYLSWTPSTEADRTTWTWSGWIKRTKLGFSQYFFAAVPDATDFCQFYFNANDQLALQWRRGSGNSLNITSAVFRDTSAWYHVVFNFDSNQTAASDKVKLWVNGVEQTFGTDARNLITTNSQYRVGDNTVSHSIGSQQPYGGNYFNGYIADVFWIDELQLTSTDFGEFDANNVWQPIEYTGSFPGKSFHLDFSDNSSASALGTDSSGNGNDWTVNNIATGTAYSTNLTPSSTAYPNTTLSNGGLTWTGSTPNDTGTVSSLTIPTNKKTYVEVTHTSTGGGDPGPGVANGPTVEMGLDTVKAWWRGGTNGTVSVGTLGSFTGSATTWSNGDVLGIALDHTANSGAGSITFYKNGTAVLTGGSGWTSYNDLRFEWQNNGSGTSSGTWNYGASTFSYPVSGHTGLFEEAGAGDDSLFDSPTNGTQTDTGAGGEVSGNYCTWNPLNNPNSSTFANGNLDVTTASTGYGSSYGTMAVSSGKWYWEVQLTTFVTTGIVGIIETSDTLTSYLGGTASSYAYFHTGQKYNNGSGASYGATYTTNDIIGVALDMDAGTLVFYKNGSSQGTAYTGLSGTFMPGVSDGGSGSNVYVANFGQRAFAYSAPSGFKALCTANFDTPTIEDPSTVMDVALWTGNGTSQTISGLGFSPDLVWNKNRGYPDNHAITDTVRGATKWLLPNGTNSELTYTQSLTAFTSDGFSVGSDDNFNRNSYGFVGWCWDAGTSTASNTSGTITSQVRANISAGFSIVSYTGNGSTSQTIGHGLGVSPMFVLIKNRDASEDWVMWFSGLTVNEYAYLDSTGFRTYSGSWGSLPTSSVFSNFVTHGTTNKYIAYCWAPVEGYSATGEYSGSGTSDGPFIYTGFRPKWLLIKRSNGSSNWYLVDAERDTYNTVNLYLQPQSSSEEIDTSSEGTKNYIDFLSNGFKLRGTEISTNATQEYRYLAFAESPFKYARAR